MGRVLPGCFVALALTQCTAFAAPATGTYATIDNRFTTNLPGRATGSTFVGEYHAAENRSGDPPYMRQMTFHLPRGVRYDTRVPARCAATDAELHLRGAAACPAASRLGGGTVDTKFMGAPSRLAVIAFNSADEMIMLARSPLIASVTRGTIAPDGSITYRGATCFPSVQPVGCPADTVLQMGSQIRIAAHTRRIDGVTRSYATTPACPRSRRWRTRVEFRWADGTEETVASDQRCRRPKRRRT